jgi:hypothetical protein
MNTKLFLLLVVVAIVGTSTFVILQEAQGVSEEQEEEEAEKIKNFNERLLANFERNYLVMCDMYKAHDALDELDVDELKKCQELWNKYNYNNSNHHYQIVQSSYDFVICGPSDNRIIYPEGTDCDNPKNNIEEKIDRDDEKIQEELEENDEKQHKEWAKYNDDDDDDDDDDGDKKNKDD